MKHETLLRNPPDRPAVVAALRAAADFIESTDDRDHRILSVRVSGLDYSSELTVEVLDHVIEDTPQTRAVRGMAAAVATAFREAASGA